MISPAWFKKIWQFIYPQIKSHKTLSLGIIIGLLLVYYWSLGATSQSLNYETKLAHLGNLTETITGSGQVKAKTEINLRPKLVTTVKTIKVSVGDKVKAGAVLIQLDPSEAEKTVRDATLATESANLDLEKMKKPADKLSAIQTENALAQAKATKQSAENDLVKARADGFNTVADTFLDLPTIVTGLDNILLGYDVSRAASVPFDINLEAYTKLSGGDDEESLAFRDDTSAKRRAARQAYDQNFADYKKIGREVDDQTRDILIEETYQTTEALSEAIKAAKNLIDRAADIMGQSQMSLPTVISNHRSSLSDYTTKTGNHLASLLEIKKRLADSKNTLDQANRSIAEKQEAWNKLRAGVDPLDLRSKELVAKQRGYALEDAQEKLAASVVRAPLAGTVARINVVTGDTVSEDTTVINFITAEPQVIISLNEVDVIKLKIGQSAKLTFDAIAGLELSAKVVAIDPAGTVTQGVVIYNTKLSFVKTDPRVRPGMSVSAEIETDSRQNVILVPNAAVKTDNGADYVEIIDSSWSKTPRRQPVIVGLIGADETEIKNGLLGNEQVVVDTMTATNNNQ